MKAKIKKASKKNKPRVVNKKKDRAGIKKIKSKPQKKIPAETAAVKELIVPKKISEKEKQALVGIFSDAFIRQALISLGGENALDVVRSYPVDVSDEELSRKLKVKISDVRSTLNKMHGEGFVGYNRKKDGETGWYSYSWSLNKRKIEGWAKKINDEKEKIICPESEKYYCKKCGSDSIIGFLEASGCEFKCSFCNNSLEFLEKQKVEELLNSGMIDPMKKRREL